MGKTHRRERIYIKLEAGGGGTRDRWKIVFLRDLGVNIFPPSEKREDDRCRLMNRGTDSFETEKVKRGSS